MLLWATATWSTQVRAELPAAGLTYCAYGAAVCRVQVDLLTGKTQVLRSDILEDCGTSLNPLIDAGQIQGAYVMGLGYMLSAQRVWDEDGGVTGDAGRMVAKGTRENKPPSSTDIPVEFNISMLENRGPFGVFGSKDVREPAVCLSCSVLLAARAAVAASFENPHLSEVSMHFRQGMMDNNGNAYSVSQIASTRRTLVHFDKWGRKTKLRVAPEDMRHSVTWLNEKWDRVNQDDNGSEDD